MVKLKRFRCIKMYQDIYKESKDATHLVVVWIPVEHCQKLSKSKSTYCNNLSVLDSTMQNSLACFFCCLEDTSCHSASVYRNMLQEINTNLFHFNIKIKSTV